ncbi:MAG: hypothetical protein ACOC1X_02995 [Promethearchaeota archaeon]
MSDENICKECGFPKDAEREPVICCDSPIHFAEYLTNRCKVCGHQKDGSTIKDDEIYEKYVDDKVEE